MRIWPFYISLILFALAGSGNLSAQQLLVTDLSSGVGPITIDQLTQATVSNPFPEPINGTFQARLVDRAGATVAILRSLPFTIGPGQQITPFDIPWLRQPEYGMSRYASDFAREGVLEFGDFVLCFEFMDQQEVVRGSSCLERSSKPLVNLSLIYPINKQKIEELHPILTWEQVALPRLGNKGLNYSLVLVEQRKNQSTAEALERNVPLVRRERLRENSLFYPAAAPALTVGKTYAWMVRAYLGRHQLVTSQQWQFTVAESLPDEDKQPSPNSFTMLQSEVNNHYQVFEDVISIGFDNNEGVSDLDYSITRITNGHKLVKNVPKIESLHPGLNTITIPMEGLSLSPKEKYLLKVKTPRGQSYYLLFKTETSKGQ